MHALKHKLQKIQFLSGLALFLCFALSGLYLKLVIKPAHLGEPAVRMMARANHIYILFLALLNLLAALIETGPAGRMEKLRLGGRILLMLCGPVFIVFFFTQYGATLEARKLVTAGVVAAALGALLLATRAFAKSRGD